MEGSVRMRKKFPMQERTWCHCRLHCTWPHMFGLCWTCMTVLEEHPCGRIKEGLLCSWRLNHCMEIYTNGVTEAGFPWDTPGILGWAVINWSIPHVSLWPVAGTVADKYGRNPVAKSLASTGGKTSKQMNYSMVSWWWTLLCWYTHRAIGIETVKHSD